MIDISKNDTFQTKIEKFSDAVTPLITISLTFIAPPVGLIASSIFSVGWSVVSALLSESEPNLKQEMEKCFDDKVLKLIETTTDKKITDFLNTILTSKMTRNLYICHKYYTVSVGLTDLF